MDCGSEPPSVCTNASDAYAVGFSTHLTANASRLGDMDESEIAAELTTRAEALEEKARQLRHAAEIVLSATAETASLTTSEARGGAETTADQTKAPKPTGDDYRSVVHSIPNAYWDPGSLMAAMRKAGFAVNYEAARTMLYRMEKRGDLVKRGRGRWQVSDSKDSGSLSSPGMALVDASKFRPAEDTPFVADQGSAVG